MKNLASISDNVKLLSEKISQEVDRISRDHTAKNHRTDSLVYIGNWQDAIPRSIWTDATLSAMDVRSWGVIRTQAVNGSAVMLSLNTLLKETLGYSKATISRVVYVLRLTRWISLCSTLRTETGRFKGHIYAIHDSPVPLHDAIYLDKDYLDFVKKQLTHNNQAIRQLAQTIWQVIQETESENHAPYSTAEQALDRLVNSASASDPESVQVQILNLGQKSRVQKMNPVAKHQVQILNLVNEKYETNENQQLNIQVQKMNLAPICSSSFNNNFNKTTTTNSEGIFKKAGSKIEPPSDRTILPDLIFPKAFNQNEIKLARMYLKKIDEELQQKFLDETAAQIKQREKTSNPIRNPVGYLSWLCTEHRRGNTYLTSAHIAFQAQRERKKLRETRVKQQQEELTRAALSAGSIETVICRPSEEMDHGEKQETKTRQSRWENLNSAVSPRKVR